MEVHVVKVPKFVGKAILMVAKLFDRSPKQAKKIAPAEETPPESMSEDALFADYAPEDEEEPEQEKTGE